jgi:hypothetical protein
MERKGKPITRMFSLPSDLNAYIIGYLDFVDHESAMVSCKTLNEACTSQLAWPGTYILPNATDVTLANFLTNKPFVTGLVLAGDGCLITDESLSLISTLPLQSLEIDHAYSFMLGQHVRASKGVTSTGFAQMWRSSSVTRNLKRLVLEGDGVCIDDDFLVDGLKRAENLETLVMSGRNITLTKRGFSLLDTSRITRLLSVKINGEGVFIDDSSLAILKEITSLREVDLDTLNSSFSDAGLAHLACLDLHSLQIVSVNSRFTDTGVLALCEHYYSLKYLTLEGLNHSFSDASLCHLKGRGLKVLVLGGYGSEFSDHGLASLSSMPLTTLILEGNANRLTDCGLSHLVGMKMMNHLALDGEQDNHFTSKGLSFLIDMPLKHVCLNGENNDVSWDAFLALDKRQLVKYKIGGIRHRHLQTFSQEKTTEDNW